MDVVNMLEAKSSLSRLVEAVETGKRSEILIARNGRPAARLVPIDTKIGAGRRIGVAKGLFLAPDAVDDDDKSIAALFNGAVD